MGGGPFFVKGFYSTPYTLLYYPWSARPSFVKGSLDGSTGHWGIRSKKQKKDMLPCCWCCHHRNFAFHALVTFNYGPLVYMVPLLNPASHFSLEKFYLEKFCMGCSPSQFCIPCFGYL